MAFVVLLPARSIIRPILLYSRSFYLLNAVPCRHSISKSHVQCPFQRTELRCQAPGPARPSSIRTVTSPDLTLITNRSPEPTTSPQNQEDSGRPVKPAPARRGDRLIIVGLGNPGSRFQETRHNVGFMVVDEFSARNRLEFRRQRRLRAEVAVGAMNGRVVYVVKPWTFMNESGAALKAVMNYYGVGVAGVMVVVDDMALEVGRLRLRSSGSAGGHNGLKSVENVLGGKMYCRLRVGVGAPRGGAEHWKNHVLGGFNRNEIKVLKEKVLWDAADVLEEWVREEDLKKVLNLLSKKSNA